MFSSHQLLRVADSFWRLSNHASNQPYFKVMQLTDSMEPAEGLEPSAPGLRKLRSSVPLCLCLSVSVSFAAIFARFYIPRFASVLLESR